MSPSFPEGSDSKSTVYAYKKSKNISLLKDKTVVLLFKIKEISLEKRKTVYWQPLPESTEAIDERIKTLCALTKNKTVWAEPKIRCLMLTKNKSITYQ